jgi:hypothetical protein
MVRNGQALEEHVRELHGRNRRKSLQSSRRLTELRAEREPVQLFVVCM